MQIIRKILPCIAVGAILLLYFFFDARGGGFPRCPFLSVTGLHCPGCGSQRALSALLHGDFLAAIQLNILLVLFLPLFLLVSFYYLRSLFGGWIHRPRLLYSNTFVFSVLVLVLSFWVLRNLPGFEWLYHAAH